MEFCVMIEPHNGASYDDQLRVAIHAEDLGFAGFFRSDHLIAGDGDGLSGPSDTWITLAALGRETSTIRLGSLMTSATFRHPSLLAVSVAQVDQMSGGRVALGLGAGWWAREHAATGIEGLVGNEGDIRRQVADFEAAGVDRLYVEILDLADLEHLNYFADAVGL
jgi:alkanesulfonate monooxygenase SsuD/methylene tetrahydromethanopterin reductase-like flavin-dependent oxidoreductase (luciferase family)